MVDQLQREREKRHRRRRHADPHGQLRSPFPATPLHGWKPLDIATRHHRHRSEIE
jgi:hypothetical protein